ncbi:LysR family transcriptional regulator [Carnobacterium sp.]|uniref:LysR family transcriptional regulator n=1 Tax=Carnobacterium sp. TaxID=48221 RepID=UPI0028ACB21B|nr:LysR family transcriptional regulator [Carnobacterium sp.]
MELRQLHYFQVVARFENMTIAATELHIAQPSLSKSIAALEQDLGVRLFDRIGKRIVLNDYGMIFLTTVEKIFRTIENSKHELSHLVEIEERSVAIGASSSRFLQDLFQTYFISHPDQRFKISHITQQKKLEQKLLDGEIDLGIFYTPTDHPEIESKPLLTEEIFLAVPPNHQLAKKKSVNLNEVANDPFISVTTDYSFAKMTKLFCHEAGFTPDIAFEIESFEFILKLVQSGLGLTFVPDSWRRANHSTLLPLLKIDAPICQRTIWISWMKNRYQTKATKEFKEFSLNYFGFQQG